MNKEYKLILSCTNIHTFTNSDIKNKKNVIEMVN